MPEYTIEMLWRCHVCGQEKNRGLMRHCRNCGHPKDDKDEESFPEDLTRALAGEDEARAKAGPDWKCRFCESLQSALNKCCTECGVDPVTGNKPWEATIKEVRELEPSGTKIETSHKETIGTENGATAPPVEITPSTEPVAQPFPWEALVRPGLAALGLLAFVLLMWLLLRTKIVDVHVASVHWEHRVLIDRYQVFHRSGFDPEPGAFDVDPLGQRFHHTEHVRVGSHTERYIVQVSCGQSCTDNPCYTTPRNCYTTPRNCTSNKNGTANCSGGDRVCTGGDRVCPPPSCVTKYCDEPRTRTVDDYEDQPRYREYYAWNAWDWGYNRTVRRSGQTLETSWPTAADLAAPLADGEREKSRREEEYHVAFAGKDQKSYDYDPRDESEFQRFAPGSSFKIKVGIARGVEVLP
jgi:hypothetical protein